ncbi:hypothetical protein BRPE64_DCDS01130 (plasmid) [Caballeronia insecticola]|uniref:Uncharacterized protein n=1 Tax=Caballeronia insecticola TaxID=758793 RepID=R4WR31_9BURK|nr:hypothetical protein BRPE64_DCDS01130 [Caballeronia insecticola]
MHVDRRIVRQSLPDRREIDRNYADAMQGMRRSLTSSS